MSSPVRDKDHAGPFLARAHELIPYTNANAIATVDISTAVLTPLATPALVVPLDVDVVVEGASAVVVPFTSWLTTK